MKLTPHILCVSSHNRNCQSISKDLNSCTLITSTSSVPKILQLLSLFKIFTYWKGKVRETKKNRSSIHQFTAASGLNSWTQTATHLEARLMCYATYLALLKLHKLSFVPHSDMLEMVHMRVLIFIYLT